MNVKVIGKIVGKIMILEGILMFFPFVVSIIYKENYIYILLVMLSFVIAEILVVKRKIKDKKFWETDVFQSFFISGNITSQNFQRSLCNQEMAFLEISIAVTYA